MADMPGTSADLSEQVVSAENSTAYLRSWYALMGVVILAAVVRLWGLQHDLPYSYYPDETHFVQRALSFGSGDLNPHWFHKPAFYMYTLFFEYGVYFCTGYLIGLWESVDEFAISFIQNPGPFYLIGRLTTAVFSLASIVAVYCLGNRHFGKHVGVASGVMLALTYGHVEASRVVKADVPSACLCIWSMYFLLKCLQDKTIRNLVLACALAGISAATKQYGLAMLLPIALSILLDRYQPGGTLGWSAFRRLRLLLLSGVVFSIAFFVCSPFNLLDARGRRSTFRMFADMQERTVKLLGGETRESASDFITKQQSFVSGAIGYSKVLVRKDGMGLPIGTVCLVGLAAVAITGDLRQRVFISFPVAFAIASILTYPGYAEPRHQCPVYPFLVVAGGAVVAATCRYFPRRLGLIYVALAVVGCFPLKNIVYQAAELSKEDTRNVAKRWIELNIANGSKIVISENGPPLLASPNLLQTQVTVAEQADPSGQFTTHYATYLKYQIAATQTAAHYYLFEIRLPWWRESFEASGTHTLDSEYDRDMANPLRPVGVETYDTFIDRGFQYAVVHSDHYGGLVRSKGDAEEKDPFPAYSAFYRELIDKGNLLKEFCPGDVLHGPVVRIYRFRRERESGQVSLAE